MSEVPVLEQALLHPELYGWIGGDSIADAR